MRDLTKEQKKVMKATYDYLNKCAVKGVKPIAAELASQLGKTPQALQKHFSLIKNKSGCDLREASKR